MRQYSSEHRKHDEGGEKDYQEREEEEKERPSHQGTVSSKHGQRSGRRVCSVVRDQ